MGNKRKLGNTSTVAWIIRIGLLFLILSFFLPLVTVSCNAFGQIKNDGFSLFTMVDSIQQTIKVFGAKLSVSGFIRLYSFWLIPVCAFFSLFISLKLTKTALRSIMGLLFLPLIVIIISIGTLGISSGMESNNPIAPTGDEIIKRLLKNMDISPAIGGYLYVSGFFLTLVFCIIGALKIGRDSS